MITGYRSLTGSLAGIFAIGMLTPVAAEVPPTNGRVLILDNERTLEASD